MSPRLLPPTISPNRLELPVVFESEPRCSSHLIGGTLSASLACPPASPDDCADSVAAEVFARIAEKWTQPVLWALRDGPLRHNELRATVPGISTKMLVQTLRALQRDGLVDRHSDGRPARVAYELTRAGTELFGLTNRICAWAHGNASYIRGARAAFEAG